MTLTNLLLFLILVTLATYTFMPWKGIDIDFYTPIFVMSRITGWSAHIMEQHASNKLIRPLSKYRGAEVREVMLLNQR